MAIIEGVNGTISGPSVRRYDLDWLRIIAFGLLIFYHLGMFYVTWGWHVKSAYAGPAAEPLMLMVNPWRLALLFFISGVAIRFAMDKSERRATFARSRLYRLGLPILAGMAVIVTPQAYFQLRYGGEIEPGYFAFWADYLKLEQVFSITTPTWNHLWYVVYLLVYTLIMIAASPLVGTSLGRGEHSIVGKLTGGPVRLLLLTPIPFLMYSLFLDPIFPTTHDLFNDWANHAHRFTIFLLGFAIAKNDRFWSAVDRALPIAAGMAIFIGAGRLILRASDWDLYISILESPVGVAAITLFAWSSIVTVLGAGQRWLNRPSKTLSYLTGAVFCYYILHQTIIVIAGFYLTQLSLGPWPEFLILLSITVAGCALGYEVVRRIRYLRAFFGVKEKTLAKKRTMASAGFSSRQ